MPDPNRHISKYRHYKPKDLAVVRIDGRDHYLGKYDSPESWEKYHRLLAEHAATGSVAASPEPGGHAAPDDLTVNELILASGQTHVFPKSFQVKVLRQHRRGSTNPKIFGS